MFIYIHAEDLGRRNLELFKYIRIIEFIKAINIRDQATADILNEL